jgi:hypothetical protein
LAETPSGGAEFRLELPLRSPEARPAEHHTELMR